uniref:Uncharacterized protein n=1 Tax=Meloidogyne incognita TaxID=6306 RepID=A0A914M4D3_MELIC
MEVVLKASMLERSKKYNCCTITTSIKNVTLNWLITNFAYTLPRGIRVILSAGSKCLDLCSVLFSIDFI